MRSLLFKVEHANWNATLQLPADATLAQLAKAIIKAVGFDMDHPYGFYDNLRSPYRSKERFTLFADRGMDDDEDDAGVTTTPIDFVFKPRRKRLFLFDYGDNWMFTVTCLRTADSPDSEGAKILSTEGTPPVQYPSYDEEE